MAAQGNQIVGAIIQKLMNSGMKQVAKNVLNSANPEKVAYGLINSYVSKNPQYAQLWKQAQEMAGAGNAKEKAANMFAERGIDIESVVDGVIREIKQ